MHLPEDIKKQLVDQIYKQPSSVKLKCIGLTKFLNDIYGKEKELDKETAKISHQQFSKINQIKNHALASFYNGTTSADAEKLYEEFFTEEERKSEDFKKPVEKVPQNGWWKNTLLSIPVLQDLIESEDEPILEYLTNIDVITKEDTGDFAIDFYFAENPFFLNQKLEIRLKKSLEFEDEGVDYTQIDSSPIQWKDGKNVTTESKHIKSKGKNRPKKTVQVRKKSFFLLFCNLKYEDLDHDDEDEEDGEGDPTTDQAIYFDCISLAETIRNDFFTFLIPHLFGIKIDAFEAGSEHEEEEHNAPGQADPKCKQQ